MYSHLIGGGNDVGKQKKRQQLLSHKEALLFNLFFGRSAGARYKEMPGQRCDASRLIGRSTYDNRAPNPCETAISAQDPAFKPTAL
jgi:hypothetical protein